MKKTILAVLVAGAALPAFAADKMDISLANITEHAPASVSSDAPDPAASNSAGTAARPGAVATPTPVLVRTAPSAPPAKAVSSDFSAPKLGALPQLQSLGARAASTATAGTSDAHAAHPASVTAQNIQRTSGETLSPKTLATSVAPKILPAKAATALPKDASDEKPSEQQSDGSAGDKPQAAPVNPFTGNSLAAEDIQRQIDRSKSQTALLQEQLKQVTLQQDISNLPYKKRAELVQMASNNPVLQGMLGIQAVAPPVPASAPKAVKAAPKKKAAPARSENVAVAHTPSVTLNGIVVDQGSASALLTIDGNSVIAPNGASTPFGRVQILNQRSANIGGQMLTVHEDTVSRMVVSDPKPVDPKAVQAFGSLPQALPKPAFSAGPLPSLPPLPLPPTK